MTSNLNSASVGLAWDASPEPQVTGYHMWIGQSFRNYTSRYDVGLATTGAIGGLSNDTAYHLAVTAYTPQVESEFSNEVVWTAPTPSPTATPTATAAPLLISGTVRYCLSQAPVPNVVVVLSGSAIDSTTTDAAGAYQFNVQPGSYTLTPMMEALATGTGGVNTADMVAVMAHYIGAETLTGCALQAADANADGRVNTVDAAAIQQFVLGLPLTPINDAGQWRFSPTTITLNLINANQPNQDFSSLVIGDVTSPFVVP